MPQRRRRRDRRPGPRGDGGRGKPFGAAAGQRRKRQALGGLPLKLVGLSGLCCAGKNYVARLLEARGIPVLDVDTLGHRALEEERDAVAARFGNDVVGPGGAVDRRALGAKVFGNADELAALEAIVHPAANRLTEEWIEEKEEECLTKAGAWGQRPQERGVAEKPPAGSERGGRLPPPLLVINAALLHKSSVFGRLDAIIIVKAPLPARLLRAMRRDGLTLRETLGRFEKQKGFAAQYFSSKSDIYTVGNSGISGKLLEKRLEAILAKIRA